MGGTKQRKLKKGNQRYQQKAGKKQKKKEQKGPSLPQFVERQWQRFNRLPLHYQTAIVFVVFFHITLFYLMSQEETSATIKDPPAPGLGPQTGL